MLDGRAWKSRPNIPNADLGSCIGSSAGRHIIQVLERRPGAMQKNNTFPAKSLPTRIFQVKHASCVLLSFAHPYLFGLSTLLAKSLPTRVLGGHVEHASCVSLLVRFLFRSGPASCVSLLVRFLFRSVPASCVSLLARFLFRSVPASCVSLLVRL